MAGAGAGPCGMQICGCSQERGEAGPRGPGTPPHSSLAREGLLASSVDRCFSQPRRGATPKTGVFGGDAKTALWNAWNFHSTVMTLNTAEVGLMCVPESPEKGWELGAEAQHLLAALGAVPAGMPRGDQPRCARVVSSPLLGPGPCQGEHRPWTSAPRRRRAEPFQSNQTEIRLSVLLAFNFILFLREALQIHGDQPYSLSLPHWPAGGEAGTEEWKDSLPSPERKQPGNGLGRTELSRDCSENSLIS